VRCNDTPAGPSLGQRSNSSPSGDLQRGVARAPRAGLAGERSPEGESDSGAERAEGMDARSERPATGHGRPRSHAGLGAKKRGVPGRAPRVLRDILNAVACPPDGSAAGAALSGG
jgi:hypothetical protein